eukprot:gb/GFBE01067862.1/.p1 GENE.gb/GFBE01067862.1/~~gb/GFBE01067862.1/.p1  ORF type:complete len:471 (+),score=112.15 gb/GFBE01067862.1/:1-1413(+)
MAPLNVAVVATADSGHMNPMLSLAEGLAERGHKIQVFTFAFGAGKYEQKIQKFGGEFVGLPCAHAEEDLFRIAEEQKKVPMLPMRDLMKPPLLAAMQGRKFDIMVADFAAIAGMEAAEEMNIPLVINLPGPMMLGRDLLGALDYNSMVSFGGLHLFMTPFSVPALGRTFNVDGLNIFASTLTKHMTRSLVLVNSFFGMEKPVPLPPNVHLTGPLAKNAQLQPLASTHPDLHAFMENAVKADQKLVYITTGTMVVLKEWMVHMLFQTMKLVGCKVIWSLKADTQALLPSRDDPDFFVSAWLPQPALLSSDKLHAVITHCGWGGTLECVEGAKPVIALPFFGDQPANAKLLVAAGAAELLGPLPPFSVNPDGGNYKPGSIKAPGAAAVVKRVLEDESYSAAAKRLKKLSRSYGLGCDVACRRIESAAEDGMDHLLDVRLATRATGHVPALVSGVGALVLLGAAAAGAWMLLR